MTSKCRNFRAFAHKNSSYALFLTYSYLTFKIEVFDELKEGRQHQIVFRTPINWHLKSCPVQNDFQTVENIECLLEFSVVRQQLSAYGQHLGPSGVLQYTAHSREHKKQEAPSSIFTGQL